MRQDSDYIRQKDLGRYLIVSLTAIWNCVIYVVSLSYMSLRPIVGARRKIHKTEIVQMCQYLTGWIILQNNQT